MSTVEPKRSGRSREPEFYGRGVSLDGPRATIDPDDREKFDRGVRDLLGRIRGRDDVAMPTDYLVNVSIDAPRFDAPRF
ncbi:hypothetical protein [Isoptericola sp. NPDC055881]